MHEFSIAKGIIETALAEAEKNNGKVIRTLTVKLSKSSHITSGSMKFCLRAAAGTIAEKARIEIELFEPIVRCRDCGHVSLLQYDKPFCPECLSRNLEMPDGNEAYLESIWVD